MADWAAAETMQSFYRHAVTGADSLSQALREAKLGIRRDRSLRGVALIDERGVEDVSSGHPFFWAPFIHIGLPR